MRGNSRLLATAEKKDFQLAGSRVAWLAVLVVVIFVPPLLRLVASLSDALGIGMTLFPHQSRIRSWGLQLLTSINWRLTVRYVAVWNDLLPRTSHLF